tara:strand:- start:1027 stop:1920 length:894 start_codon:yes stop_codon:yes gene_type:complete
LKTKLLTKSLLIIFIFSLVTGCANFIAHDLTKPNRNIKSHKVQINDIQMSYYTLGDKDKYPLVFLHGALVFTDYYNDLIENLSKEYYIIGVDIRGHGRTTLGTNSFSFNQISKDIIELTNQLEIKKFNLVGHSLGGIILLYLSKDYPNKINKGVSIASLYHYDGIDFNNNKFKFFTKDGFREEKGFYSNYILKVIDKSYHRIGELDKYNKTKVILAESKSIIYPELTTLDLNQIETPILVFVAEKDKLIRPSHTIKMSNELKNSNYKIVKNANHDRIVINKKFIKLISTNALEFLME